MKIDKFTLSSNAVFAPIAGFSDVGMRSICADLGAGITYTEMISAKGLVYGSEKTEDLLHTTDSEKIKAVQIFGSEPDIIERAVNHEALQKFDIIDINMGCPVPKIVKNGEGSALLKTPDKARQVVQSARKGGKTVTVKFRIGFEEKSRTGVDFAKMLEQAGASAIAVHGRTREQYYSGNADWDYIAEIVKSVSIPVIANGDVFNAEDYKRILATTGADGVMIARGALGNPQIFSSITNTPCKWKSISEIVQRHIAVMRQFHSDTYVANNMKKQIAYYCKGLKGGKQLKMSIFSAKDITEMLDVLSSSQVLDVPVFQG